MTNMTQIIQAAQSGDQAAQAALLEQVYAKLKHIAINKMRLESPGNSLQPTILVHDAWERVIKAEGQPLIPNRGYFFAAAAKSMYRILVEHARRERTIKRGGKLEKVPLDDLQIALPAPPEDLLDLAEAMEEFGKVYPEKALLVKLRFFSGLTFAETSLALGITTSTAKRWSEFAQVWLKRYIKSNREQK